MAEAHTAREEVAAADAGSPPRGVPQALPLAWAAVCLVAFAAGWWLLVPHDPAGDLRPQSVDPTAGVTSGDLERIGAYRMWTKPFEVATLVLPVAVVLLLGLTPVGARLTARIGAGVRLQALRALIIAFAVVGIAWVATLPASAALGAVSQAAGALSGGWSGWAVRRLLQLVEWWALAGAAVLGVRASARLLRRSWWWVLTLVAFALVLVGTVVFGRLTAAGTGYPSLPYGPLRDDVVALAGETGVGVSDVQVVPQTPTTTTYNAYVTGVGDTHVVVLYTTLLRRSTRAEVDVVAAHELGHVAADDSYRRALLASFGAALMTALVGAAATSGQVRRAARTRGVRVSDAPAVPMLIALTVAAGLLVTPVLDAASRAIELRADLTALQATGDPVALRAVVGRSAALYLSEPDPAWPWRMLSGHPSPAERVALADAWAAGGD